MVGRALARTRPLTKRDKELLAKLCMVGAAGLLAFAEHLSPSKMTTRRKEGNRK